MKLTNCNPQLFKMFVMVLPLFSISWFSGDVALIRAVQKEDILEITKLLDNGVDVNQKGSDGRTPLMIASEKCNIEIIKLLLSRGAKVLIYDNIGVTAYSYVGYGNPNVDINLKAMVNQLLDEARNKELSYIAEAIKDDDKLIKSAYIMDIETVRSLIEQGHDINIKGTYGWTALIHAVANCDIEMTKLLLNKGAEFDQTINKFTCIHAKVFDFNKGQIITRLIQDARIKKLKKKSTP